MSITDIGWPIAGIMQPPSIREGESKHAEVAINGGSQGSESPKEAEARLEPGASNRGRAVRTRFDPYIRLGICDHRHRHVGLAEPGPAR
jgi:hypothetical protein